jgi:hypothetical protein
MKTKIVIAMGITSLAALPLMARPGVIIRVGAPPPPAIVVQAPPPAVIVQTPPPAVTVDVGVPDYYVWDGVEFVGVVGTDYYYLGPGNVWIMCDPVRLARFHTWEGTHVDWRAHATVNMHYRTDAHGHDHPWHGDHGHGH